MRHLWAACVHPLRLDLYKLMWDLKKQVWAESRPSSEDVWRLKTARKTHTETLKPKQATCVCETFLCGTWPRRPPAPVMWSQDMYSCKGWESGPVCAVTRPVERPALLDQSVCKGSESNKSCCARCSNLFESFLVKRRNYQRSFSLGENTESRQLWG